MNYKHHIIRNFPAQYSWLKKIFANLLFFFGGIVIHPRNNLLNHRDAFLATCKLRKGDVVLVGGLRRLSSVFIGGPVTHAMLYVGCRKFIHSVADGVEYASLHDVFCEYDTLVILRPENASKKIIKSAITCGEKQVGKPYDFDFKKDARKFYCSELVNFSYRSAGFNSGLIYKNKNDIIKPVEFIYGNFEVVFLSHNLEFDKEKNILLFKK